MSLAAMAAGADGIIVEVHHNPAEALSDKDQAMTPEMFAGLMKKLEVLRSCMKEINNGRAEARSLHSPPPLHKESVGMMG
jgi:3-deoxy-7-phosphoheptulonate synthase